MIERLLRKELEDRLSGFPAVGLLGPRQVGKTTLARQLVDPGSDGVVYLDLENPADLAKLEDARGYLERQRGRLVVVDEVQRSPGLFKVLRGVIDERIRDGEHAGQFLLLGSASVDLLRQSSESLAGRIAYLELSPLDLRELEPHDVTRLWVRGGFPRSFLAADETESVVWRDNFIRTYLERDIPALGPRVPAETLRRFWSMLAHAQGSLLNQAALARSLAVDGKTVANYLDLMVDLLLVRRLQPLHANVRKRLVKSPKTYVRDSGLVHTLLRIDDEEALLGHPIAGMSWEGFAIETLIRAAAQHAEPAFYRTATGVEVDLVLDLPGNRRWAFEIERSVAPKVDRGLRVALDDLQPDRTFVVYTGAERYPAGDGIEVLDLNAAAADLAAQR